MKSDCRVGRQHWTWGPRRTFPGSTEIERTCHVNTWGKNIPGRGNSKCQVPVVNTLQDGFCAWSGGRVVSDRVGEAGRFKSLMQKPCQDYCDLDSGVICGEKEKWAYLGHDCESRAGHGLPTHQM